MLNSFFNPGFKAAKCKTLLKLSIPRIKLLRNRRELQIKQMRKDIAKLLETGQEATARIRVEHIIREENMMAAQEIIELFCELIAVRLPIIEAQRECPLDLKEAIASICFAAPRCADLPELLQVQMLFASKYGREFVAAATELLPECGVNRQVMELLSVRAPSADKKLKLLKEIAEEHGLDWDSASSETELFKPHEDLLNGPRQFDKGSKVPLPKDKHEELIHSISVQDPDEHADSDSAFDPLDFPEVPKVLVRPSSDAGPESELSIPAPSAPHPELDNEPAVQEHVENLTDQPSVDDEQVLEATKSEIQAVKSEIPAVKFETPILSSETLGSPPASVTKNKQFVPLLSSPTETPVPVPTKEINSSPFPGTKSDLSIDLQDVLAAAQAAALSAEHAAAAARSAASLAQVRISELTQKMNDQNLDKGSENPFSVEHSNVFASTEKPHLEHQYSVGDSDDTLGAQNLHEHHDNYVTVYGSEYPVYDSLKVDDVMGYESKFPTYDSPKVDAEPSPFVDHELKQEDSHGQPQRTSSMGDDPYFAYPNLFTSHSQILRGDSFTDGSHLSH
ncbi:IST1-like protein [Drosera capensis]